MLAANGALSDIISAGARVLESACGPCIGLGFAPAEGIASLRTFNRNFSGRSGTRDDRVYLVSPETAVASALTGKITDPRRLPKLLGIEYPQKNEPEEFIVNDNMIEPPLSKKETARAEVIRGSTIVVPKSPDPLPDDLNGEVLIKCGDKVTTDHIMPAGAFLKYRSNVPEYSSFVFHCFNVKGKPTFAQRATKAKQQGLAGIIVAGASYGQGSSREHAALCPMYLGVRVVIAKTIERIHRANLINFCVVPIELAASDYEKIKEGDKLIIDGLREAIKDKDEAKVVEANGNYEFIGKLNLSGRDREILLAGGLLKYTLGKANDKNSKRVRDGQGKTRG
jgi:aconitate hydratase